MANTQPSTVTTRSNSEPRGVPTRLARIRTVPPVTLELFGIFDPNWPIHLADEVAKQVDKTLHLQNLSRLSPLPKEAYPHHTPEQILEANAIQSYWENHWAKIVKEQDKKLGKERIEFTVLPEPPFPGIFTFVLCTLDPLLPWRLIKSTYEVALEIDHGQ